MKKLNLFSLVLCAALIFWGCSTNNTLKGGLIGGGSGAALGGVIGGIAGKGKGALIGAAVGTAVGTTAGVIIGKKMDKAAEQVRNEVEDAQVEEVVDNNGLQAVKVTFDSGILFGFNSSELNAASQASLTKLAHILEEYPTMDIAIYGHTDKVGTYEANQTVSTRRAQAVENYLRTKGVNGSQFKYVEGKGYDEYNEAWSADQNRRVEIFLYASEEMIREAEAEIG